MTPNNTKLTIAEIPPVIDGACLTVFLSVSWRSLFRFFDQILQRQYFNRGETEEKSSDFKSLRVCESTFHSH